MIPIYSPVYIVHATNVWHMIIFKRVCKMKNKTIDLMLSNFPKNEL